MKNICVYCGSSGGKGDDYLTMTEQLGKSLVQRNIGLVYGGASVGLMGRIADSVLQYGGRVTGVTPQQFVDMGVVHDELTELHVVTTMHQRKAKMAELADGFIALPGGYGTLEELLEVLTWAQLGLHTKPCAIFNMNGYFDTLLAFLDSVKNERFLNSQHRELLLVDTHPESLLNKMESFQSVYTGKSWD